jgi:hypothetical protein
MDTADPGGFGVVDWLNEEAEGFAAVGGNNQEVLEVLILDIYLDQLSAGFGLNSQTAQPPSKPAPWRGRALRKILWIEPVLVG